MMKNFPNLRQAPGGGFWFDRGIPKAMRGWPVPDPTYHTNRSKWQINLHTKDEARAIDLAAQSTKVTDGYLAAWKAGQAPIHLDLDPPAELKAAWGIAHSMTPAEMDMAIRAFLSVARTVAAQTPTPLSASGRQDGAVIATPPVATSAHALSASGSVGALAAGSRELITQHFDQFVKDTLAGKYSTIRSYRGGLAKFVAHAGVRPIHNYIAPDCAEWYMALTKTGNKHNSIVKDVRAVKAFFAWAKNRLLIAIDPAAGLKVDVKKNKAQSWEQFTLADLHALFDPLALDDHRRMFCLLVLHAGLDAPSEVDKLDRKLHDKNGRKHFLCRGTKDEGHGDNRTRYIPVAQVLLDNGIEAWLVNRPWSGDHYQNWFNNEWIIQTGVKPTGHKSLKSFRSTFRTALENIPAMRDQTIDKYMGHTSKGTGPKDYKARDEDKVVKLSQVESDHITGLSFGIDFSPMVRLDVVKAA